MDVIVVEFDDRACGALCPNAIELGVGLNIDRVNS